MKISSVAIKIVITLFLLVPISCELFIDEPQLFKISYNENNSTSGSVPIDKKEYEKGQTANIKGNSGVLKKTDYKFESWNTTADGLGTDYIEDSKLKLSNSNITLFAKWTVIPTYTITFNSNPGSDVDDQIIKEGGKLTAPTNPTRTDYTFTNWYVDSEFVTLWDFDEDVVSSDITIYAKWVLNTYTVTFDSNNGSDVSSQSIEHASKVTKPTDPTITGYTFTDWYTDAELTTLWDFDTSTVTADITLYAGWAKYREMVAVTGGTFLQDTNFNHTISSFSIGKYEVTYELWYSIYSWATNNGYSFSNAGIEGNDGIVGETPTTVKYEPVTTINWRDTIIWCNAYSEKSGRTPVYENTDGDVIKDSRDSNETECDATVPDWSNNGYRLPTQGEWQFAARGGNSSESYTYSGSNTVSDAAWFNTNSDDSSHEVGEKASNELGLYDMSGNAMEWLYDWYGTYPGDSTDYKGAATGSFRAVGGGSWDMPLSHCEYSNRFTNNNPRNEYDVKGFRIAHN